MQSGESAAGTGDASGNRTEMLSLGNRENEWPRRWDVLSVATGCSSIAWEGFASVSSYLEEDGIWCQPIGGSAEANLEGPRPALFLDRDGVIVEDVGYLHRPGDVRLVPGAAEVIAAANRAAVPVIAVTNQSGIGRGLYGWAEFTETEARIAADLAARGAHLNMIVACPFHADGTPPYRHPAHPCRKPQPGMILRAGARLGLDLARSWIVGDRATDLAAGCAAGLAGGLHVLTGHGPAERQKAQDIATKRFQVQLADSIVSAMGIIPQLKLAV